MNAGAGRERSGIKKAAIFNQNPLESIDFESRGWPGAAGAQKSNDFQLHPISLATCAARRRIINWTSLPSCSPPPWASQELLIGLPPLPLPPPLWSPRELIIGASLPPPPLRTQKNYYCGGGSFKSRNSIRDVVRQDEISLSLWRAWGKVRRQMNIKKNNLSEANKPVLKERGFKKQP